MLEIRGHSPTLCTSTTHVAFKPAFDKNKRLIPEVKTKGAVPPTISTTILRCGVGVERHWGRANSVIMVTNRLRRLVLYILHAMIFLRLKRIKTPGRMMKVFRQISAMSDPEITSLYFRNAKNSFLPRYFLVFSEMDGSRSFLFSEIISREHVHLQHEKDPYARLLHSVWYKIVRKPSLI